MKTPLLLSDLPMNSVTAESARQILAEIEAECLRQALAIAFAEIEKDLLHGGCQIFFPKDLERFIPKVAANLKDRGFSVCQIPSETLLDAAITVSTRPWIGVTWTKSSMAQTASKKFAKEPSGVSTKCLSYAKMLFNGSGATENRVLEFVANNPGVSRNEIAAGTKIRLSTVCGIVNRAITASQLRVVGTKLDGTTNRSVEAIGV